MSSALRTESEMTLNDFLRKRALRKVQQYEKAEPGEIAGLTAHAVMANDRFLAAEIMPRLATSWIRDRRLAMMLRRELEDVFFANGLVAAQKAIAIARQRARGKAAKGPGA